MSNFRFQINAEKLFTYFKANMCLATFQRKKILFLLKEGVYKKLLHHLHPSAGRSSSFLGLAVTGFTDEHSKQENDVTNLLGYLTAA